MFLKIKNTRINLNKIVYYRYRVKTEYTKPVLIISYDGTYENEDTFVFETDQEVSEIIEILDKTLGGEQL